MSEKKADVWMPLFVGDYLADTGHLSTVEHGAYLLLLMTAWLKGGALPDDSERLRRITRMERDDWLHAEPVLREFFVLADDGTLHNARVDAELVRANRNIAQKSEAGKKSAAKRAANKSKTNEPSNDEQQGNEMATPVEQPLNERCNEDCSGESTEAQRNGIPSPSPSPATTTDTCVSVVAANATPDGLPPLPAESDKTKRIGLVCRLLRSKGVNCNPTQFAGKYAGLEQRSDDDFLLAVDTLQLRGEKRLTIGLVAAVLGDIAEGRQSRPITPAPRGAAVNQLPTEYGKSGKL